LSILLSIFFPSLHLQTVPPPPVIHSSVPLILLSPCFPKLTVLYIQMLQLSFC
jgi:hypothetical protein